MGWLEELAKKRGYESLRAVACAMRESECWPVKDKRDVETVANKLRHVDKGVDVAWWIRKGRPLLPVLAEVLEEDEDELLIRIQNARPPSTGRQPMLWPFKMFPELRAIDFDTEEPFPGVPSPLLRYGGPRELRTWWVAPIGAGKTLVGQWLAARYDWTFIHAETWTDVTLPLHGRVFVELTSLAGTCIHTWQEIPPTVTICIACPNLPLKKQVEHQNPGYDQDWMVRPNFRRESPLLPDLPDGFNVLYTCPAADWGDKLLQWIAHRVTPGGGFNVDQAHELLFHQNLHTLFGTPGDLIGFLGIVDQAGIAQSGVGQSETTMYMRWIGVWLKAAAERFVHDHPSAEIQEFRGKHGAELLREIEMKRLRHGLEPLLTNLQWLELIPRGHSPELNRERFAELVAMGVVVQRDAGQYGIQPVWLANALHVVAIECLYNDAPNGVGSLLLYKNTSENALRRLIRDVCGGNFRCIEACLKTGDPSTPEQMVALDGVFRAMGVALMNDVPVPMDWVHKIWVWQMRHTIQRYTNWPPIPILQIAEHSHHDVTGNGGWLFAAFSISRALTQAGVNIGCSMLNPWCELPEDAGEYDKCIEVLESAGWVGRTGEENTEPDLIELSVYRFGAALYEKFGLLHRHGRVLNSQEPDILVALANGKAHEIPESEWGSVLGLSFGLKALEEACLRQKADCDDVLRWCWSKWGMKTDLWQWPAIRWLGRHGSRAKLQDAERLWKLAPADTLPETFYAQLTKIPEIWLWLDDAIWARWLDVWSTQNGRWSERTNAFNVVPQSLALQAIRDGRVDGHCHHVRSILWTRMPLALLELIDELALLPPNPPPKIPDSGGPIAWLVYAAPAEHCAALVERARGWLAEPAKYPGVEGWVRRWLTRVIEQRASGWREAYALVDENAKGSVDCQ